MIIKKYDINFIVEIKKVWKFFWILYLSNYFHFYTIKINNNFFFSPKTVSAKIESELLSENFCFLQKYIYSNVYTIFQ